MLNFSQIRKIYDSKLEQDLYCVEDILCSVKEIKNPKNYISNKLFRNYALKDEWPLLVVPVLIEDGKFINFCTRKNSFKILKQVKNPNTERYKEIMCICPDILAT